MFPVGVGDLVLAMVEVEVRQETPWRSQDRVLAVSADSVRLEVGAAMDVRLAEPTVEGQEAILRDPQVVEAVIGVVEVARSVAPLLGLEVSQIPEHSRIPRTSVARGRLHIIHTGLEGMVGL